MNLIQFEGRTVAVIAPEDLEALEADNARLRERLNALARLVWDSRWVSEDDDYQRCVGIAAEIRSGNFRGIDAALADGGCEVITPRCDAHASKTKFSDSEGWEALARDIEESVGIWMQHSKEVDRKLSEVNADNARLREAETYWRREWNRQTAERDAAKAKLAKLIAHLKYEDSGWTGPWEELEEYDESAALAEGGKTL